MNKRAIIYLRFSSDEQSNFSIERQDMITKSWMSHQDVELIDSFIDEGFTATNFDRPHFKKQYEFIEKNFRNINYLVVSDLTRFSREAGDAINIVKKIQLTYGIKIVSATRGMIYDVTDPNSFFMMGLEFLLGNTENIKRADDINSGIYAAKAIKHQYIGPRAPFGYRKEVIGYKHQGKQKLYKLVPVPEDAAVVRFIYDAYLRGVPNYIIEADARDMGLRGTRNSLIERILACPVYSGYQVVKPYKDQPGGIFPLDIEPIVDLDTWNRAQQRLNRKGNKPHTTLTDDMPLRGVLHCHCGRLLTGAPSRSKTGRYYHYYKCQVDGRHNNVSAINAHKQLLEIFEYMSLSDKMVNSIILRSEHTLSLRMKTQNTELTKRKNELEKVEADIYSLEKKWIAEQISFETYNRWHNDYTKQRNHLRAQVDSLANQKSDSHTLLLDTVHALTDVRAIYEQCDTPLKQELIRAGFDNTLYYEKGSYRTLFLIPELSHNELKMSEKGLLYVQKKGDFFSKISSGGGEGTRTPVQT